MQRQTKNILLLTGLFFFLLNQLAHAQVPADSTGNVGDDTYADPLTDPGTNANLGKLMPSNYELKIEVDSNLRKYYIYQKVGDLDYRPVSVMTFQEFAEWDRKRRSQEYWDNPNPFEETEGSSDEPLGFYTRDNSGDTIVEIVPSGNVTLDFGARWQRVDNPAIPVRQQRNGGFDFDQQISMNVVGKIGERLKLTANWDTKATFDFDNSIKIDFIGKDYDIIRTVEAGNVSFPLKNSLMRGSQNLFGAKVGMQFGKLSVTSVMSSQRGKTESITIKGGAQSRNFELRATDYDDYRHFFLSQYFRDNFEKAFEVNATNPNTGFRITRVEVYITNSNTSTENTRNLAGFMDLGEHKASQIYNDALITPTGMNSVDNDANTLFGNILADTTFRQVNNALSEFESAGYVNGVDFEVIKSARKLEQGRDYTFHPDLGYISLTSAIQEEEALAVAFEYTLNGESYKVGELNEDYQSFDEKSVILLKLLKPQSIKTSLPYWDLMMKNIYSLNTSNLNQENFQLRVVYEDDITGVKNPTLQEGALFKDIPLVQVFRMDKLNMNLDFSPDGNFDYVEGATVLPKIGKIVFPVLEPFGDWLVQDPTKSSYQPYYFDPIQEVAFVNKYVFSTLYESTQKDAERTPEQNKFIITGSYQSASSQTVMLPGINIAPGSVVVTSAGIRLREGSDYTVDYTLGRVSIKNEGILASGKEITIQYEKSDLFNFRTKSLFGTRFDYEVNKDFNVGATWLFLNERPLLSRVTIGDEPLKNHMFGADVNFRKKSRIITKAVDFLPGISTKEEADVSFNAEIAGLAPGKSRLTKGASIIDDFEGAETPFDLTRVPIRWNVGSTPLRFSESSAVKDDLTYSYHRAKLAWYNIDNTFYASGNNNLGELPEGDLDNPYFSQYTPQDLFPGKDPQQFQLNQIMFNMAYFPNIRGPYNYNDNPADLNPDGTLANPEDSWAAITRSITFDTDFDAANVQFIEFWLLNPFLSQSVNDGTGGDLYFNLGDISEDVLKDNRHAFENGLPENVENTAWGKVTTQQYLTNAFENDPDTRGLQDVGLDGVSNEEERDTTYFGNMLNNLSGYLTPDALNTLSEDPSSDDFRYYVFPSADEDNRPLLERYADFNGLENNSPANDGSNQFTASNKTTPDNEDLNQDNTISSAEGYYEYHLPITPSTMQVGGHPFIVGERTIDGLTGLNGTPTFVQVRIPIKDPSFYQKFGSIDGFKTIKFLRTYLTGFQDSVILRMAQFQLVASQWIQNTNRLNFDDQAGLGQAEPNPIELNIGTVNIEENSQGTDETSPYVIHDEIIRDQDNTTTIVRQLNEQSLRLQAKDLGEGEYGSVYKDVSLDLINYKRLNMFIHAETADPGTQDGDLVAFFRLGKDRNDNYYQIEVPLTFSNINSNDPDEVWRVENEIDIELDKLVAVKANRNRNGIDTAFSIYSENVDGYKISVIGNPRISEVRSMLIGVRHPYDQDETPKSATIWCNELRVIEFVQKPGMATKMNFTTTLPGLGNLSATFGYVGPNFGGIEDKISQRTREHTLEYGVAANLGIDKFLPKKLGLRLPLYVAMENKSVRPKFNPLDQDMEMGDALEIMDEIGMDDEGFRTKTIAKTKTKTINIQNAQKVSTKPNAKKHPLSTENFKFSAGYTETRATGIGNEDVGRGNNLESHLDQLYTGGVGYSFNMSPKYIEPFKKAKFLDSKALGLIKDININLIPNQINVRGDLNRLYRRTQLYNNELNTLGIQPNYEKRFSFNRTHSVRWNLTKSISAGYTSTANALVDEPNGDKLGDNNITREEYQDSVWKNLQNLGRLKNFSQNVDANYKLPLKKFPLTDWMSADVSYKAGYTWVASPFGQTDTSAQKFEMGHTIQNNQDVSVNGKLDMVQLYNKIPILKKVNTPKGRSRRGRNSRKPDPKIAKGDTLKNGKPRPDINPGLKIFLRTLMSVRNVNIRGSIGSNTTIPGFLPTPTYLGMEDFGAPGIPFILGSQNPNIRYEAAENGWLTKSPSQNNPFRQSKNIDYNIRSTVEPFSDFRLQVNVKRNKTNEFSEIFRTDTSIYSSGIEDYFSYSPLKSGGFNTSYISLRSAGLFDLSGNKSDEVFSTFESSRYQVKQILDNRNSNSGEYGVNSQDVLVPSFLAAYGGGGVDPNNLNYVPKIPLPNWRLDYAGLSRLEKLRKKFSSINITHSYQSTYQISSFTSSLEYGEGFISANSDLGNLEQLPTDTNGSGQFIPVFVVNEVSIQERFSPLLGINVRTRNRMNFKVEYKTDRSMTLSMANAQITEVNNKDIVIGFGWTTNKFVLPFKWAHRKIQLKRDLTFKVDLSFRDTRTVQRTIEGPSVVTAGNINFRLNPNITYSVSEKLNLQMFFERSFNEPRISSSFRRSSTAFGVRLKFSLA